MQPVDTLLVFFLASLVLAITPGPDNLFVLAQAAQKGKKAGITITLGLSTGIIVHTSAVAFGVAALFQASTLAFSILKTIGAGYLLYLAYLSFTANSEEGKASRKAVELSTMQLYRRGIVMNVTNPKVSIFFLAFLPQFTDPQHGPLVLQFFILGALFILSGLIVFGCISVLAGQLGEYLRRSTHAERYLNRLAGTLFVGLAIKLALTEK